MRPYVATALMTLVLSLPATGRAGDDFTRRAGAATATVVNVSVRVPEPRTDAITEQDAREWLARYLNAWETRDVATLAALGAVSPDRQEALRNALDAYVALHVSVSNATFTPEGTHGLLSFDRTDSDETGKQLKHPRYTLELERRAAGVVSTHRQLTY